jgi:uncharacterized membrane protein
VWLIFLELTVLFWGWTFVFPGPGLNLLVIWALGCSMIVLSLLVRLPVRVVAGFGIAMIALHNLADTVRPAAFGKLFWVWIILHRPGFIPLRADGSLQVFALYPLIPWVGVMAVGYAFGAVLMLPAERRRRVLCVLGASLTGLFVLLRATNLYGNPPVGFTLASPGPFVPQPTLGLTLMSFLDTEKYPPSLQFLLMTLGPSLLLLAWFDRFDLRSAWGADGRGDPWQVVGRFFLVFGRVPFFFYVLHIYLVHALALIVALAWGQPIFNLTHGGFMAGIEPGYGHGLGFVYLMWFLTIALLYLPCRWFLGVKERRRDWWLSYL